MQERAAARFADCRQIEGLKRVVGAADHSRLIEQRLFERIGSFFMAAVCHGPMSQAIGR